MCESSTPIRRTRIFGSGLTPMARAIFRPSSEMNRAKLALLIFSARRLFSTMSQRCAVRLHGTPEILLANSVIVAVVPAQWQCMWPALHWIATAANHTALGTTARFLRAIGRDRLGARDLTAAAILRGDTSAVLDQAFRTFGE